MELYSMKLFSTTHTLRSHTVQYSHVLVSPHRPRHPFFLSAPLHAPPLEDWERVEELPRQQRARPLVGLRVGPRVGA